ncbi:MAG TPA: Flp pilus assembly protein CpaB [Chloroflexota bacterium]|nr:Flp pilus assembly protein CpaB [Chloroflexota bacterium]
MGSKPKRTSRMFMILGAVLTLLSMAGVYFIANSASKSAQSQMVSVLVAQRTVPAHTVFRTSLDAKTWFTTTTLPVKGVPLGTFPSTTDFANRMLLGARQATNETIYPNEPVLASMFTNLGAIRNAYTLAFSLKPGDVAISFQVSSVDSVAGAVQPGDYIDLVDSYLGGGDKRLKNAPTQTQYVLQNVKVLGVGPMSAAAPGSTPSNQSSGSNGGSSGSGLLTVELSHQEALLLQNLKDFAGVWHTSVVLRSAKDHGTFSTQPLKETWFFHSLRNNFTTAD